MSSCFVNPKFGTGGIFRESDFGFRIVRLEAYRWRWLGYLVCRELSV